MGSSRRAGGGLSGRGAVVLALGVGLAGALVDVLTGPGLRTAFAVCFVGVCLAAAALVRRRDLPVAVVMPPLVYAVLAAVAVVVQGGSATGGSFFVRQGLDLFTALVLEAPVLLVATAGALVVVLGRGLGRRHAVRRSGAPVPLPRGAAPAVAARTPSGQPDRA